MKDRWDLIKTKLKPHQKQGIRLLTEQYKGRAILADDMGLGKTIQSLTWAVINTTGTVVIVCEAGMKAKWKREARKHCGQDAYIANTMTPTTKRIRQRFVIINYNIILPWLPLLRRMKPELVIIDECQNITSPQAKRTKRIKRLCHRVPYVLGMSGTPVVNNIVDLWPMLNILNPKRWNSVHSFGMKYSHAKRTPWGWQYKGGRNLKLLYKILLKKYMLRRTDEVLNLPPLRQKMVVLGIKHREEYDSLINEFESWLNSRLSKGHLTRRKRNSALRAEAFTKIGYARRYVASECKLHKVIAWIEKMRKTHPNRKMIVFGIHKSVLRPLYEHFKKESVIIDGTIPVSQREEILQRFQKHKKTKIIFAQMKAAGSGLDMTAATIVVKVEIAWNPATHAQCVKRAHRIGQTKAVDCYYLVAKGTIEEKLCRILQEKQALSDSALDGKHDQTRGDLDIFNRLLTEEIGFNLKS